MQLSLANRADSSVRRQIWTPVMVEGWALYCEEMMGEAGYYLDRRTQLLQLKDYLWRSCRVLIDVGLHTGNLSFDEAVRVLVEVANPGHPYGVRGVGEVPIVPPPAAIANAIYRAVGVRLHELPMSPGRVCLAMNSSKKC